jgi:hypothetical protein
MLFLASTPGRETAATMSGMKSYALALWLAIPLLVLTEGCTVEHDYAVVVSWTLNGYVPDEELCSRLGIAHGRFEVMNRSGRVLKTLEADCDAQVWVEDDERQGDYGGFETSYAFDWDTRYYYKVTLVDASGNPVARPVDQMGNAVSQALEGEFSVGYDRGEILSLPTFDYVQPIGGVASLTANWSENSGNLPGACAAKQIESIRIVLVSAENPDFELPYELARANCADGRWASNGKVLEIGSYRFRYEAHKPGDPQYPKLGAPIPVIIDGTSEAITLRPETFLFN